MTGPINLGRGRIVVQRADDVAGGVEVALELYHEGRAVIGRGGTEREALGDAYEFLTRAAAAVLVRR